MASPRNKKMVSKQGWDKHTHSVRNDVTVIRKIIRDLKKSLNDINKQDLKTALNTLDRRSKEIQDSLDALCEEKENNGG